MLFFWIFFSFRFLKKKNSTNIFNDVFIFEGNVTLKTGVKAAENSASPITGINYIWKYIKTEYIFHIVTIFHKVTVFTVFLSK